MTLKNVRLDDVCNIRRGTTITKKQTKKGNIPVIGGGIKPTYFHNESNRKSHCITISGSGANAGFVNYWEQPIYASDCSTVEPLDDSQDTRFVFYYLLSVQKYIYDNFRSGAAQPHVYAKDIATLKYPLLSIEEQKLIVSKLDISFAKINTAISKIKNNIKNSQLIFEKIVQEIFVENVNNYKFFKLSDISEYFNGLTYSPKDLVETNGTIVLRSSNIQNGKIDLRDIKRVNKSFKDKLYVNPDDILICSRNGSRALIGKSSMIGKHREKMTFGTFMMIVRSKYNDYLQWFFKSNLFKKQILKGENPMINQITRYMLDEVKLPIPDSNNSKIISEKFNNLDIKVRELTKINQKNLENYQLLKLAILKSEFKNKTA